jgi:hypothetical protein
VTTEAWPRKAESGARCLSLSSTGLGICRSAHPDGPAASVDGQHAANQLARARQRRRDQPWVLWRRAVQLFFVLCVITGILHDARKEPHHVRNFHMPRLWLCFQRNGRCRTMRSRMAYRCGSMRCNSIGRQWGACWWHASCTRQFGIDRFWPAAYRTLEKVPVAPHSADAGLVSADRSGQ